MGNPYVHAVELENESAAVLTSIKEMTAIESPTTDKEACNRMAGFLQQKTDQLGLETRRVSNAEFGDHVVIAL